jgi:gliding motility-associated-like protein
LAGTNTWSTSETSNSIDVNISGNYMLEVDDGTYQYCDSILVTVIPQPVFSLGGNQYLCDGQSADLSGPAGYTNYLWSTTETTDTITVSTTGTYWLQVGPNFCQGSDTVLVDLATYSAIFLKDTLEICSYEGLELDATRTGASYQWSTNESTPTITITEADEYSVEVTLSNGCTQEETVEVIPCLNSIGIPNTITPNGDGVNDTWIIEDIYNYPNNSVKILDRSGRLVFESTNYNNDWAAENLPATVYYYIVDLGNGGTLVNGTITVIRE